MLSKNLSRNDFLVFDCTRVGYCVGKDHSLAYQYLAVSSGVVKQHLPLRTNISLFARSDPLRFARLLTQP